MNCNGWIMRYISAVLLLLWIAHCIGCLDGYISWCVCDLESLSLLTLNWYVVDITTDSWPILSKQLATSALLNQPTYLLRCIIYQSILLIIHQHYIDISQISHQYSPDVSPILHRYFTKYMGQLPSTGNTHNKTQEPSHYCYIRIIIIRMLKLTKS